VECDATDAVVTPVVRGTIAFEQFAHEHADARGREVSTP
jgi:hypothetical protein